MKNSVLHFSMNTRLPLHITGFSCYSNCIRYESYHRSNCTQYWFNRNKHSATVYNNFPSQTRFFHFLNRFLALQVKILKIFSRVIKVSKIKSLQLYKILRQICLTYTKRIFLDRISMGGFYVNHARDTCPTFPCMKSFVIGKMKNSKRDSRVMVRSFLSVAYLFAEFVADRRSLAATETSSEKNSVIAVNRERCVSWTGNFGGWPAKNDRNFIPDGRNASCPDRLFDKNRRFFGAYVLRLSVYVV